MWLNEWDVEAAVNYAYDDDFKPNAFVAAITLRNLMNWVNENSDGWPYWQAPNKASRKLQDALYKRFFGAYDGRIDEDLTDAELKAALTPIKSFRTKYSATFEIGA